MTGATSIGTVQFRVLTEVINESDNIYQIVQSLEDWQIKKMLCYASMPLNPTTYTGNAILYLSTNSFLLEQDILSNWTDTINAFYLNYQTVLDGYGIDVYYNSGTNYMILNALYSINNTAETYFNTYYYLSSTLTGVTNSYLETRTFFNVSEQLTNESSYVYETDKLTRIIRRYSFKFK